MVDRGLPVLASSQTLSPIVNLSKLKETFAREVVGRGRSWSTGAYIKPKALSFCKLGKTQRNLRARTSQILFMVVQAPGPRSTAVDRGLPVPTNLFWMFCTSQRLFYDCTSSGTPVDRGRPRSTGAHEFILDVLHLPETFLWLYKLWDPDRSRSTGCTSSGTPVDRGRPVPTNFFVMFCTSQRLFYDCTSSGTPVDRDRPRIDRCPRIYFGCFAPPRDFFMVVQALGPRSIAVDRGRPVPTNFFWILDVLHLPETFLWLYKLWDPG